MDMGATLTDIIPTVGMVYMTTDRAGLTCVGGISVLNFNACKFSLYSMYLASL